MIQIELPCCDSAVVLADDAETVRCETCSVEHLLAPDARPASAGAPAEHVPPALAA